MTEDRTQFEEYVTRTYGQQHLYFKFFGEDILYIRYDKNFHSLGSFDAYLSHFKQGITPVLKYFPQKVICGVGKEESSDVDEIVYCVQAVDHTLSSLKGSGIITDYVVFANDNHGPDVKNQLSTMPNVMSFYWFLMVYNYYYPEPVNWNSSADKFLYLPGNPQRRHRIYSMYKLHREGLLHDKVSYSWSGDLCNRKDPDPNWYAGIRELLLEIEPELTIDLKQFIKLIHSWDQDRDDATIVGKQLGHYMMHPVSEELYNTGCIELIAETWMPNTYHLTEKTWRAIFAGQPFVPVETDFINAQLESMGFKTFAHYSQTDQQGEVPHSVTEFLSHVKYCVDNSVNIAERFVSVCKDPVVADSIRSDIEHNRQVVNTYVHNIIAELDRRIPGFHNIAEKFFTQNGP